MSFPLSCVQDGLDDSRVPPPLESGKTLESGASLERSEPAAQATPECGDSTLPGTKLAFRWPANGEITSEFGVRRGKAHRGIDIAGYRGKMVRAAAAGTVVFSGRKNGYGRVVILKHAGSYETVYAHNMDTFVLKGAEVEAGQPIADMGATGNSTGPHLHFEVRLEDRALDPLACLPIRPTTRG